MSLMPFLFRFPDDDTSWAHVDAVARLDGALRRYGRGAQVWTAMGFPEGQEKAC
jgi:hypothetical protein